MAFKASSTMPSNSRMTRLLQRSRPCLTITAKSKNPLRNLKRVWHKASKIERE
ncbi:Uncharacterised protein [Vibrio cholerae]|nr:Uncharacterised protein [Vibrio cholerae]